MVLGDSAPPLVAGLAVVRALERQTAEAARAAGWLEEGGALWQAGATVVVVSTVRIDQRSSLIDHRAADRYDRTRQSSTTATTTKTMFIDQAASHGERRPWPPTAFMIWIPVR
jgi:hypothetical protein